MPRSVVTITLLVVLLTGLFLTLPQNAMAVEAIAASDAISQYWQAQTSDEISAAREGLLSVSQDVQTLYQWLKSGPDFASDTPTGVLQNIRLNDKGESYPYAVLIPDNYNASTSYPVEFMLHGGVGRPRPEAGDSWWRGGFDSLMKSDRITVVPAAWQEAFWWHSDQAENLSALVKLIKQRYNIDDNRVSLTGISDGGTGAYFFAFKLPTVWASFLPFIAHPGVLRNPQSGGGYNLYFENLTAKPLYIVNGENDPLYPVSDVMPFIEILRQVGINHQFTAIEGGGHNTSWMPQKSDEIEQFKLNNPRDPFPEMLQWVADESSRYNRNLWIQIDKLVRDTQPGIIKATRNGNVFDIVTDSISAFTLLLNPEEVDFTQDITVIVNSEQKFRQRVKQDVDTLLKWFEQDWDKQLLFTAELSLIL